MGLVGRSSSREGIDIETFRRFIPLPGLLGERAFVLFTGSEKKLINWELFLEGMERCGLPEDGDRLVFHTELCAVSDTAGVVTRWDLASVLGHMDAAVLALSDVGPDEVRNAEEAVLEKVFRKRQSIPRSEFLVWLRANDWMVSWLDSFLPEIPPSDRAGSSTSDSLRRSTRAREDAGLECSSCGFVMRACPITGVTLDVGTVRWEEESGCWVVEVDDRSDRTYSSMDANAPIVVGEDEVGDSSGVVGIATLESTARSDHTRKIDAEDSGIEKYFRGGGEEEEEDDGVKKVVEKVGFAVDASRKGGSSGVGSVGEDVTSTTSGFLGGAVAMETGKKDGDLEGEEPGKKGVFLGGGGATSKKLQSTTPPIPSLKKKTRKLNSNLSPVLWGASAQIGEETDDEEEGEIFGREAERSTVIPQLNLPAGAKTSSRQRSSPLGAAHLVIRPHRRRVDLRFCPACHAKFGSESLRGYSHTVPTAVSMSMALTDPGNQTVSLTRRPRASSDVMMLPGSVSPRGPSASSPPRPIPKRLNSPKDDFVAAVPPTTKVSVSGVAEFSFDADAEKCGILRKRGRRTGIIQKKYVRVNGHFLYISSDEASAPTRCVFLQGTHIDPTSEDFGFSIRAFPGGEPRVLLTLFAESAMDRDDWIAALRTASSTSAFDDAFELGPKLGRGKFATVHKAKHVVEGTEHAVKIIEKTNVSSSLRKMLRTEIAALNVARHPRILRLDSVHEDAEKIYLVTELVHGGDLLSRIQGRTRFTEAEAKRLARPLFDALVHLHRLGVVHRDIKPENILTNDELFDLKLADFGLAALLYPGKHLDRPCGTVPYLAPELASRQPYDHKVDVWAAGIILFLVVRGRLPYDGSSDAQVLHRIRRKRPDFEHHTWAKWTPQGMDFIQNVLHSDPAHRLSANEALSHPWLQTE